jgi:hypothetical protein
MVERTQALLQRMQAADALSLTNRLKRAGIRGADVAHLSRSTVAGIVADAGRQLRHAGTGSAEGDELRAGRREVRALLGVLREMFGALGEMRVVLNEVVLDPGSAQRVSEAAMDPSKAAAAAATGEHGGEGKGGGGDGRGGGWMAPLSKLFAGGPASKADGAGERERATMTSPLAAPRPMHPRFVPKLGPALAASATTVNVEFSGAGAGVGRAMTSTIDATPAVAVPVPTTAGGAGGGVPHQGTPGVMGIFAGAPVRTRTPDPWVVIPRMQQRAPPSSLLSPAAAATGGRRHHPNRMSRNVDAVLDGVGTPRRQPSGSGDASGDEEPDYLAPLLQRTLRRRGLSDSSIHSTFTSQAAEDEADAPPPQTPLSRTEAAWLESGSVLHALTRRVQSFRSGLGVDSTTTTPTAKERSAGGGSLSGSELGTSPPGAPAPIASAGGPKLARRSSRASREPTFKPPASTSGFGFLANLVPSGETAEIARSLREQDEGMLARTYRAPGGGERDYM